MKETRATLLNLTSPHIFFLYHVIYTMSALLHAIIVLALLCIVNYITVLPYVHLEIVVIRACTQSDFNDMYNIINDAAQAYRKYSGHTA